MSALDSTILKSILTTIFFEDPEDGQYVVPKQGNWYNPQDTEDGKIATWIAYAIPERESVLKARSDLDIDNQELNIITELVVIDLQFVGQMAEQMAVSVEHWPKRADIAKAFEPVSGQVRDDKIRVVSSWFKQEGMNTTYAYNVRVRVYCANVQETGANKLWHFSANGSIS